MTFIPPALPANPPISPPGSLLDFAYVPQFSLNPVGIRIYYGGIPTAADGSVVVAMYPVPYPATTSVIGSAMANPILEETVSSTSAGNPSVGVYQITFSNQQAAIPGYYRMDWFFVLNGQPQMMSRYIQIGPSSPSYDALQPPYVNMVESVWSKFADIYDSPYGGPYLTTWYNQHFGRGRVASLMDQACQHLNNEAQPATVYSVTGVSPMGGGAPLFPLNQFAGLLNTATTVEVVKHLKRSYVEEPDITGNVSVRQVRRDYQQRWGDILNDEMPQYQKQLAVWKVTMMFNGSPRVLIQGGAFGNYGVPRTLGMMAARPSYYMNRYF